MLNKLFLQKGDSEPTQEEWIKMGNPKVYKPVIDELLPDWRVIVWSEIGYGGLRLQVGEEWIEGKDMVEFKGYLALDYYYTSGEIKLFHEVKI